MRTVNILLDVTAKIQILRKDGLVIPAPNPSSSALT